MAELLLKPPPLLKALLLLRGLGLLETLWFPIRSPPEGLDPLLGRFALLGLFRSALLGLLRSAVLGLLRSAVLGLLRSAVLGRWLVRSPPGRSRFAAVSRVEGRVEPGPRLRSPPYLLDRFLFE